MPDPVGQHACRPAGPSNINGTVSGISRVWGGALRNVSWALVHVSVPGGRMLAPAKPTFGVLGRLGLLPHRAACRSPCRVKRQTHGSPGGRREHPAGRATRRVRQASAELEAPAGPAETKAERDVVGAWCGVVAKS
uniref:Uncharacterized protein n=1 Tax=Peronospora matthiolae TaxID=2874970 RepID=A0AAV1TYQ7_9STRA